MFEGSHVGRAKCGEVDAAACRGIVDGRMSIRPSGDDKDRPRANTVALAVEGKAAQHGANKTIGTRGHDTEGHTALRRNHRNATVGSVFETKRLAPDGACVGGADRADA